MKKETTEETDKEIEEGRAWKTIINRQINKSDRANRTKDIVHYRVKHTR